MLNIIKMTLKLYVNHHWLTYIFIAYITGVILPINVRGNIYLKIVLLYKMQLLSSN